MADTSTFLPPHLAGLVHSVEAFKNVLTRLGTKIRWDNYYRRDYVQSSLHHSVSLALLTAHCAEREQVLTGLPLDATKLVVHALVHDFCESVTGDVTYQYKNDPRVRHLHPRVEREAALRLMNGFGFLAPFLQSAFCMIAGSTEATFFDAMERLDYFLYALHEYAEHGHIEFVKVFGRQHAKLSQYARSFMSVGELYTSELQGLVEAQIAEHPELVAQGTVSKVEPYHIDDVVSALGELVNEKGCGGEERAELLERIRKALGCKDLIGEATQ